MQSNTDALLSCLMRVNPEKFTSGDGFTDSSMALGSRLV